MLVLTRKLKEGHTDVVITAPNGDIIKVALLKVNSGKQVRIGFAFPDDYIIDRAEVYYENKAKRDANLQLPLGDEVTFV